MSVELNQEDVRGMVHRDQCCVVDTACGVDDDVAEVLRQELDDISEHLSCQCLGLDRSRWTAERKHARRVRGQERLDRRRVDAVTGSGEVGDGELRLQSKRVLDVTELEVEVDERYLARRSCRQRDSKVRSNARLAGFRLWR